MSELLKRSITGSGIGIFVLGSILLGEQSYTLFICLLALLVNFELYQLLIDRNSKLQGAVFSILASIPLLLGYTNFYEELETSSLEIAMVFPILGILGYVIKIKQPAKFNGKYILTLIFGAGYISTALLGSIAIGWPNGIYDYILPLGVILFIWANDVFAYLVGSQIGKHPLAKQISPKKTWEGTIGGTIFTLLSAFLFYFFSNSYSLPFWMGLGLCVSIFSTLGDLIESSIKRYADAKDSGTIFPGHGGAFDRFDSLICVLPIAALYVFLFL